MIDILDQITAEEQATAGSYDHQIKVCISRSCLSSNSEDLKQVLEEEVIERGLEKTCKITGVGCLGLCSQGPLVAVDRRGAKPVLLHSVTPTDAEAVLDTAQGDASNPRILDTRIPFFQRQQKVVLENTAR